MKYFNAYDGFAGGIYFYGPDNDFAFGILEIPAEVDMIYVELKDIFIDYISEHLIYINKKKIVFFEVNDNIACLHEGSCSDVDKKSLLSGLYNKFEVLKEYENIQYHTHGEISFLDANAIFSLVNNHAAKLLDPINAIEVGSWMGCSTYFFAKALDIEGKDKTLFCIDTWGGSNDVPNHQVAGYLDTFSNFRSYMRYFGVYGTLKPMIMESQVALKALKDDYFDIVFVDADHRYENVYADIKGSIKKLKVGGILIGHDCECYAEKLPSDIIEKNKNKDYCCIENKIYHPGVIRALSDIFGDEYFIHGRSTVWYKIITQKDKNMVNYSNK